MGWGGGGVIRPAELALKLLAGRCPMGVGMRSRVWTGTRDDGLFGFQCGIQMVFVCLFVAFSGHSRTLEAKRAHPGVWMGVIGQMCRSLSGVMGGQHRT